ncbi:MAG: hypothetical protein NZZ60_07080 [Bacteroidia bacterium]|nr:hypothetical protein [Bacteroidia bacterium]MCX7652799.1 hypothetical protein [Bacteroidia bacterium]MDW8417220.1 hypothetical protein [Bacteroidia bacterium]
MSVDVVLARLFHYEHRRSLRWTVLISLLWVGLWVMVLSLLKSKSASEEMFSEAEVLMQEAYFYPIDL